MANTIYNIDINFDDNFDDSGAEREVGIDISTNRKLYQRDGTLTITNVGENAYIQVSMFTTPNFGNLRRFDVIALQAATTARRVSCIGANTVISGLNTTVNAIFRHWASGNSGVVTFSWSAIYSKTI